MMTESEVRKVIHEVLAAEKEQSKEQLDNIVMHAVANILLSFGIDDEERLEIRSDMAHLRRTRKAYEAVQNAGLKAAVGVVITGLLGALWLGIQSMMHK